MPSSPLAHLATLAATAALVWTVVAERLAGRVPLVSLGRRWFGRGRTTAATVSVGIGAGVLLVAAPLAIEAATRGLTFVHQGDPGSTPGLLLGLVLTLVAKLALVAFEEIAFRGALLDRLKDRVGAPLAVIGAALVFGVAHAARPGDSSHALVVAVTFVDGLGYGAAAVATSSLWTPLAWHAAKNLAVWQLTGSSSLQFAPGLFHLGGNAAAAIGDVVVAGLVVLCAVPLIAAGRARRG
jgi:membrane protease YdiL (CAAX protease family)